MKKGKSNVGTGRTKGPKAVKRRQAGRSRARAASPYSFGIVLSGGGSFGAWEIGALQALWDVWTTKHPDEDCPPIRLAREKRAPLRGRPVVPECDRR